LYDDKKKKKSRSVGVGAFLLPLLLSWFVVVCAWRLLTWVLHRVAVLVAIVIYGPLFLLASSLTDFGRRARGRLLPHFRAQFPKWLCTLPGGPSWTKLWTEAALDEPPPEKTPKPAFVVASSSHTERKQSTTPKQQKITTATTITLDHDEEEEDQEDQEEENDETLVGGILEDDFASDEDDDVAAIGRQEDDHDAAQEAKGEEDLFSEASASPPKPKPKKRPWSTMRTRRRLSPSFMHPWSQSGASSMAGEDYAFSGSWSSHTFRRRKTHSNVAADVLTRHLGLPKIFREDPLNWLEVCFLCCVWLALILISLGRMPNEVSSSLRNLLAFACMLMWLRLLAFLRAIEGFAPFVTLVTKTIFYDLRAFIVVLGIFFTGLLHAAYMNEAFKPASAYGLPSNKHISYPYLDVEEVAFYLYQFSLIGEELREGRPYERTMDRLYLSIAIFIMVVIMLSVLIASVSESYENSMARSNEIFWRTRFELLVSTSALWGDFAKLKEASPQSIHDTLHRQFRHDVGSVGEAVYDEGKSHRAQLARILTAVQDDSDLKHELHDLKKQNLHLQQQLDDIKLLLAASRPPSHHRPPRLRHPHDPSSPPREI